MSTPRSLAVVFALVGAGPVPAQSSTQPSHTQPSHTQPSHTQPSHTQQGVAPAVDRSGHAKGFQRVLWVRTAPKADAAFYAAIQKIGFNGVSVTGGQDPAEPGRHGLRFYRDQIVGKGILELRDEQFRPLYDTYLKDRDDSVLVRPAELSATKTLLELAKTLSEQLEKAHASGPIAVSLGDEVSVTTHANPLDFCFGDASMRRFRAFMRARYRSIDRLNGAWKTDFASFARLRPFTADAIRAREFDGRTLPSNLAPWAAHREFMDREFARIARRMMEQVAARDPRLPCGLTGMQQPSAYGGHDYSLLMPVMSFFEAYDIGGARDLAMSVAKAKARQVHTLFPLRATEDARLVGARLVDMLAHGMWGTVVWSSKEIFAKPGVPSRYGRAIQSAFQKLGAVADEFAGAEMRRSPVWMVESQASVRAWWMLDSKADGDTWIKRLSSYEAKHSTSLAARHGWIRLLEDLGLQPLLVPAGELAVRLVDQPPRVLILPATIAMSDPVAVAIRGFVARGGTVVADHTVGLYDDRLRLRDAGALDSLFGIRGRKLDLDQFMVHEGKPQARGRLETGPAVVESGIRAEAPAISEPVAGFHVQFENRHGEGRAFYLNLAICEYGAVRLDPAKEKFFAARGIRGRVRHVLRQANIAPPVLVQAKGMPTCLERAVLTGRDGSQLLAVRVNALEAPQILAKLAEGGPYTAQLGFRNKTVLVDVLTGKEYPASTHHELPLDPYLGLFCRVRKP